MPVEVEMKCPSCNKTEKVRLFTITEFLFAFFSGLFIGGWLVLYFMVTK